MTRKLRVQWNSVYGQFFVLGNEGGADLPKVSLDLRDALGAWQTYLFENYTPQDSPIAGVWRPGTRTWFVEEARRLEDDFRSELSGSGVRVRVDPFPGIVPIRIYADYSDWPLWSVEGGTSPDDFPTLSDQLRDDLIALTVTIESGRPPTPLGDDLAHRLGAELGPEFEVTY